MVTEIVLLFFSQQSDLHELTAGASLVLRTSSPPNKC